MSAEAAATVARPTAWFGAAACVGIVHAGWSVYWALGGTWMLASVGQWAVQAAHDRPLAAQLSLWTVALAKIVAAVVPLLAHRGLLPWPRVWRALTWAGAVGLLLYGLSNVIVSGAVLAGVITPDEPVNTVAHQGHAYLWGPLFAVWGLALLVGLRRSAGQWRSVGQ